MFDIRALECYFKTLSTEFHIQTLTMKQRSKVDFGGGFKTVVICAGLGLKGLRPKCDVQFSEKLIAFNILGFTESVKPNNPIFQFSLIV